MPIFVTGGAGFIGSHVAEHFARKNFETVVYDNLARSNLLGKDVTYSRYNWDYLASTYRNVKLVNGDVRDRENLEKHIRGCELAVHAAAQVAVTTSVVDPLTDFMINAYGTLNLLEAARKADCGVIFFSTNKVYGERVNTIPMKTDGNRYVFNDLRYVDGVPEDFPTDATVHTPYGCSKLAADLYVQDYAQVYGLDTVVLRLSCIYGERQFGVEDQGWLAHFVRQALSGKPITIYGDGKQVRDVLYVRDLVKAVDKIHQNISKHRGEVFNIGGGPENAVSLLETITYLEQLCKAKIPLRFENWRPADQKIYISNIKKAKARLDWSPETSWKNGLKILYDWMKDALFKQ
uniref:NAD-dependent epimerase/dehydratase n=1 Tax=Caldiarchaeum subterraneum TaxID=311458 RepID=E6NA46_CALS0|nr:NAD-dependent epimerase/dehydratase [Candidatus Caldarchaeum subterraneum]